MRHAETDADLSTLDRAVVNAFQGGFPVVERPWEPAAAALSDRGVDVTGADLLAAVRDLDDRGVLSRFGALVNAEEIGGTATLVAMHAPPERFDEVAETVNAHREVAHNYEREHPHLNMWFVVSVADGEAGSASDASSAERSSADGRAAEPRDDGETASERVDEVLAEIEAETGEETYDMPKEREFHVGATFLLDGPVPDGDLDCSDLGPDVTPTDATTLTPAERDLVVEIQGGLPITETPYADVADAIDRPTAWVVETIKRFDEEGKVRRVGVIPNHYALGYTENGMTVWDVPDEVVDEAGEAVADLDFVTHCYRRPRHEGVWPYNFFAMTHGRDEAESERRVRQVRDAMADHWDVTDDDWDTLFSTRILKKTGIRLDERADAQVEAEDGTERGASGTDAAGTGSEGGR